MSTRRQSESRYVSRAPVRRYAGNRLKPQRLIFVKNGSGMVLSGGLDRCFAISRIKKRMSKYNTKESVMVGTVGRFLEM